MSKPEIMSPAGSFASMQAAIDAGCDSIFFGVEQLNMRARSSYNFKIRDLEEVAERAKKAGIRTYVTMNTLLYQHDLKLMQTILDEAKRVGLNAVIVADVAGMQYAKEIGLSVHASTQLSIYNYEAVKFYANFADTIVLAREVDMTMMKTICEGIKKNKLKGPGGELVKIEVFVHGALCIAQSGRCQMSLLQNNTSAQRGACLQECRKKYRIIDDETGKEMLVDHGYVMSPTDLCTIGFLDKLIDAGVSIFKIEGRGRSPQYVDMVTRCYREAAESIQDGTYTQKKIDNWMINLKKVYNRGFSDGYYLGRPLPEWSGSYGSQSTEERVFAGLVQHYFGKPKIAEIKLQAKPLKKGDRLVIMGGTTGIVYAKADSIMMDEEVVEEAKHPSLVTVPIGEKVRKNDKVYILRKRVLSEKN